MENVSNIVERRSVVEADIYNIIYGVCGAKWYSEFIISLPTVLCRQSNEHKVVLLFNW